MTPKEILIAARAKIEAPERWTRGTEARDYKGYRVNALDKNAVCWCTVGAIRFVEPTYLGRIEALDAIQSAIKTSEVVAWNDASIRTHAEVLAAFDRAIAAAGDA